MPNNYKSNPMVIDTVTAAPVNTTTLYNIKCVEWIIPTTALDVADLQDKDGNQLVYFSCITPKLNLIKYFQPSEAVYGLHIPTLGSSKLLIHKV